ncbi:MAG: hypothetical protein OQK82_08350, partial [Candidatus Pacearchaeota archaeon]|nr:hypothetical protein [Candidatus Pacearchaeota archaeon]
MKENTRVVNLNEAQTKAIVATALALSFDVSDATKRRVNEKVFRNIDYPHIVFDGRKVVGNCDNAQSSNYRDVSFSTFLEELTTHVETVVVMNGNHMATIDGKTISIDGVDYTIKDVDKVLALGSFKGLKSGDAVVTTKGCIQAICKLAKEKGFTMSEAVEKGE